MLTASDKFFAHLRDSHVRLVRVGLYTPVAGVYTFQGYFGLESGTLTLDGSRNIIRQAQSLRVGSLESTVGLPTVLPARDFLESLTADSAEIAIEWGLRYPDLTEEWVTLARLRVEESTQRTNESGVTVTSAYDAGTRLVDFNLILPYAPVDGSGNQMTALAAIQELVNLSYPSGTPPTWIVDPAVDSASTTPTGTVFTGQRWDAVQQLAAMINVTVAPDHLGNWTVRPAQDGSTHVWVIDAGATGVLVEETTEYSRRDQFNAVGVRWESPTSNITGLAYIVDNDPASPTYYDGPFGRKPRPEETVATITTEQQAIDYARSLLLKYRGRTRGITLTALHNPLLEPGDVIAVLLPDGTAERHIIDTISIPLTGATMQLQTRVLRGGVTYEEAGVTYEDVRYSYAGQGV